MIERDAQKMVENSDYLRPSDRLVMSTLLRASDFNTCEITKRYALSQQDIARRTGLHPVSARKSIAHLRLHRWFRSEGGCGRGHKMTFRLLADDPDLSDAPELGSAVVEMEQSRQSEFMEKS